MSASASAGGGSGGGGSGGGSRRFRSGIMFREESGGGVQYHAYLKGHELQLFLHGMGEGEVAAEVLQLEYSTVLPSAAAAATATAATSAGGSGGGGGRRFGIDVTWQSSVERLSVESKEDHEAWLGAMAAAAVPELWPGGKGLNKRPQPLLYSAWALEHARDASVVLATGAAAAEAAAAAAARGSPSGSTSPAAAAAAASAAAAAAASAARPPLDMAALEARVPSPFARLAALKSVPPWQRKGLLLQKLRQCSVVFDGVDSDRFQADREVKRNTLLEVLDYVDSNLAQLSDSRVLEDIFTVVRLNLFRPLPRAPPGAGAEGEEEEASFVDPQWPHLNIVYELLLRLVSSDAMDLTVKKRLLDPPFVRALLLLFDSEDSRERDFLKTITHRVYSKLTQRRALIRRVICTLFQEFVLEAPGAHNGIGAMLEILASVINGFAVPIKEEHKATLVRALLPLHKAASIAAFHPQLTYCMALYASKDHTLARVIVPGLLRFWPHGVAAKQMMFLNELEDIFEYVLVSGAGQSAEHGSAWRLPLPHCSLPPPLTPLPHPPPPPHPTPRTRTWMPWWCPCPSASPSASGGSTFRWRSARWRCGGQTGSGGSLWPRPLRAQPAWGSWCQPCWPTSLGTGMRASERAAWLCCRCMRRWSQGL